MAFSNKASQKSQSQMFFAAPRNSKRSLHILISRSFVSSEDPLVDLATSLPEPLASRCVRVRIA